jgi:hypothetical protein
LTAPSNQATGERYRWITDGSPAGTRGADDGYINPSRPDLFYANSRIKEVLVSSEKGSWIFQIQDTPHPQILPLPDSFDAVLRFTIMDVYEGNRYSDTSLAGIYFLRIRGQ